MHRRYLAHVREGGFLQKVASRVKTWLAAGAIPEAIW
jgi:hypothetical protein